MDGPNLSPHTGIDPEQYPVQSTVSPSILVPRTQLMEEVANTSLQELINFQPAIVQW